MALRNVDVLSHHYTVSTQNTATSVFIAVETSNIAEYHAVGSDVFEMYN